MRKIIHKCFFVWDFDKEEKWLNEMAEKGLSLVSIGFFKYTFEECIPGEYNIRLELLENLPTDAESENYIKFVEETGAEYLGSIIRWVYFRKKTNSGEFNLFSDNNSRVKHLNRLLLLIGILALSQLCIGFSYILINYGLGRGFSLGGIFNLCLGLLIGYGFFRTNTIRNKLKKEQQLFE